jgi:hypothetical protein
MAIRHSLAAREDAMSSVQFFQHTDGGLYRLKELSTSTVDKSTWVVYEHVWPFEPSTWHRPLAEWESRFTQVSATVIVEAVKGNREAAQEEITRKREARKSAEASAPQPTKRRTLEWSDPSKANSEIMYNHVIAETPFGRILITWKGWKDDPGFTVDEHPLQDVVGVRSYCDLDDAKAHAEDRYFEALNKTQEGK